jgi:hypothetical protein
MTEYNSADDEYHSLTKNHVARSPDRQPYHANANCASELIHGVAIMPYKPTDARLSANSPNTPSRPTPVFAPQST